MSTLFPICMSITVLEYIVLQNIGLIETKLYLGN